MKKFGGFPARMEFTPVPNLVFSGLLPEITDMAELKTTLHVMAILYRKKGSPRFATFNELLGNASLMATFKGAAAPEQALSDALKMAADRGTFIKMSLDNGGAPEDVFLLNDESNRQAVEKIQNGELKLGGLSAIVPAYVEKEDTPDIFTLYEENIGILTPMIAEELREAGKQYPETWIRDAIREAVKQGKRKWYKVSDILERWSVEGKSDGAYQRHPEKTDPDKYIKGKYGHMVQR